MIRAISIRGLGPHRATSLELDPKGAVALAGASQSGKTTLIDAVCWVLWGVTAHGKAMPAELIHDGEEQASVTLELGSGTRLTRKIRRAGKRVTRELARKGEADAAAVSTERAWADAIGPLGRSPDLARIVLAPLAWTALAEGAGGGRPLRDLLAGVLPATALRDVVAEMAGADFRAGDSVSEKEMYGRRADANRDRDELVGQLRAAEESVQRLAQERVEQPDPARAQWARSTLDLAAVWAAWAPLEAWEARAAELGPRPDTQQRSFVVSQRRAFREQLGQTVRGLEQELAKARAAASHVAVDRSAVDAARATVAGLERRVAAGLTCAECGQNLPDAEAKRASVLVELETARGALGAASTSLEVAIATATSTATSAVRVLEKQLEDAQAKLAQAAAALDESLAEPDPGASWDAAHRALGQRPAQVSPPHGTQPTDAEVREARALQERLTAAAGERRRVERERERAAAELERLIGRHKAAVAESERLDRLVEVIRRAPSVVAARQVEALGDLGPVQLRMPETGPAIEVLVDGRPWWTASRGRLAVADLHLRAALRRVMKLPWLTLFVDNVQDWSGEWPEVGGPVVSLRTVDAPELAVVAA